MNHMIHIAAITQLRLDTEGRAYYRRKLAEAKTPMESLRCLKRRLSDAVYRQLVADAQAASRAANRRAEEAGPGGHSGASSQSSAADLSTPVIGSSDQPLPGPAATTLPVTRTTEKTHEAPAPRSRQRRAGAVKMERPTGRTTLTATSAGAHSTAPKARP